MVRCMSEEVGGYILCHVAGGTTAVNLHRLFQMIISNGTDSPFVQMIISNGTDVCSNNNFQKYRQPICSNSNFQRYRQPNKTNSFMTSAARAAAPIH